MKKTLMMISLALLMSGVTMAQTKVVDKSSKKTPAWLTTAPDGYIIATVYANSIGEAQTKVHQEILEQVIAAVATNVSVKTTNVMSEENINDNVESRDQFVRSTKMNTANMPFLKNISTADIEEVYWVKLEDKKTKKQHYEYTAKYPFSTFTREKLVREFEQYDDEKNAQYKALADKLDNIESIDEIKGCISQLEALEAYFFDDVRLEECRSLKQRYKDLYSTITVTGAFIGKGQYQCQLLVNGFPVRCSTVPKVTSNCAGRLSVTPNDGAFIVSYDAADCLPEEENMLKITFNINGKRYNHEAFLTESGGAGINTFSVVPEGRLVLIADSVSATERKLFNITIRMTVNNRGGHKYGLKAIELHVPELASPIIFDDINAVYETKGIMALKFLAEGAFRMKEAKPSALSMAEGSITFVNPETGAIERKRLSLAYSTNWEK